jgi:hypothetical protein
MLRRIFIMAVMLLVVVIVAPRVLVPDTPPEFRLLLSLGAILSAQAGLIRAAADRGTLLRNWSWSMAF